MWYKLTTNVIQIDHRYDKPAYHIHSESLVIPAIWLALSSVTYSRIALFFALNHIFSKSHLPCSKWHHFCSISHHFCFEYKIGCKSLFVSTFEQTGYEITDWTLQFQNGCNKVVIELSGMQFWSESTDLWFQIELKSRVWFQTKLHSTRSVQLPL